LRNSALGSLLAYQQLGNGQGERGRLERLLRLYDARLRHSEPEVWGGFTALAIADIAGSRHA